MKHLKRLTDWLKDKWWYHYSGETTTIQEHAKRLKNGYYTKPLRRK